MSTPSTPDIPERTELPVAGIATARSYRELGDLLVAWLRPRVSFDRFNIGLLDMSEGVFTDAYVHGANVAGRRTGHRRTLTGTVVEAGIAAGVGIRVGGGSERLLQRFPGFGPVLASGMRAMLAAPVRDHGGNPVAALVLAAADADAFDDQALALVNDLGRATLQKILLLGGLTD